MYSAEAYSAPSATSLHTTTIQIHSFRVARQYAPSRAAALPQWALTLQGHEV
jgi:hypothetical protein